MRNMRNKILSILNAATTPDCGACEYYKTDCGRYGCNGWQISDNTLNEITDKILELTDIRSIGTVWHSFSNGSSGGSLASSGGE